MGDGSRCDSLVTQSILKHLVSPSSLTTLCASLTTLCALLTTPCVSLITLCVSLTTLCASLITQKWLVTGRSPLCISLLIHNSIFTLAHHSLCMFFTPRSPTYPPTHQFVAECVPLVPVKRKVTTVGGQVQSASCPPDIALRASIVDRKFRCVRMHS